MMTPSLERQTEVAESRAAVEAALLALDADWMALADLVIGGGDGEVVADYVLMHPRRGIVLIDIPPGRGGDPAEGFRKFLEHEDFGRFFPGFLPVISLVIDPEDAAELGSRIDAALAALPPLGIEEPDWAEMVNTMLVASETQPSAALAAIGAEDEALEDQAEPSFSASGAASSVQPPRDAALWQDNLAPAAQPAAKIGPDTPRLQMRGPVRDERFAPAEESRRWPVIAVVAVVLLGVGVGWAVFYPSLLTDTIPFLSRLLPSDRAAQDAAATPAPTASSAVPPEPAEVPPVAQDLPKAPPPPVPPPASANSPAAAAKGDAPGSQPVKPPPAVATVNPPPEPAAPPPPDAAAPAPATPAPANSAPNVATAKDAASAAREPASPQDAAPPLPPPSSPAKPAPRRSVAAAKTAPAAKPATEKPAPTPARTPSREEREARRAAAAAAGAEATDALNRAELASPTQTLQVPPGQDPGLMQDGRGYGGPGVTSRQPAPFEDRTLAALPPSYAPPAQAAPSAAYPPPSYMQPAPNPAQNAPSRPTSLLPSSRVNAPPGSADDALSQGAGLDGNQPPGADGRVCRIYNSTKTILGRPQPVTGLACKGADGRWQLVTEAPAD
jgi:hypothetical protein